MLVRPTRIASDGLRKQPAKIIELLMRSRNHDELQAERGAVVQQNGVSSSSPLPAFFEVATDTGED